MIVRIQNEVPNTLDKSNIYTIITVRYNIKHFFHCRDFQSQNS
jgi:hypothetical protein